MPTKANNHSPTILLSPQNSTLKWHLKHQISRANKTSTKSQFPMDQQNWKDFSLLSPHCLPLQQYRSSQDTIRTQVSFLLRRFGP